MREQNLYHQIVVISQIKNWEDKTFCQNLPSSPKYKTLTGNVYQRLLCFMKLKNYLHEFRSMPVDEHIRDIPLALFRLLRYDHSFCIPILLPRS